MNRKSTLLFSAFALIYLLANSSFARSEEDYLFELLEHPQYLRTWEDLISTEENVAPWLANYSKTKNGPTTPGVIVHADGKEYRINFVCKTHDCGNNMFYVMFSTDGLDAWGLLLSDQHDDIFFGNPDKTKENLLRSAANL